MDSWRLVKMGTRKLTTEQIKKIIELTKEGKDSRRQIAEKVGCSKNSVYMYQKAYGLLYRDK